MTSSTPANSFVTDTMGLVLHLEKRKLSKSVNAIFEAAETGETVIYIPAIVLSEVLYLSEKKRIDLSISDVDDYLKRYPNYKEYPLSFSVIQSAAEITDIKELHDRLIAGTSLYLDLDLITNDPTIKASKFVNTIW